MITALSTMSRITLAALSASCLLFVARAASAQTAPSPATEAPAPPPPVAAPMPPNGYPAPNPYPYPYPPPYGFRYPGAGEPGAQPSDGETRSVFKYQGGVVPPGYHLEERANKALVISGSLIFGLPYLLSVYGAVVGADSNEAPFAALFVPVIGPFIVAGSFDSGGYSGVAQMFFVADGFMQATGAALFIAGFLKPRKYVVRGEAPVAYEPELRVGPGFVGMSMKF